MPNKYKIFLKLLRFDVDSNPRHGTNILATTHNVNDSSADRESVSHFLPEEQASKQPLIVPFSIRKVQRFRLRRTI